MRKKGTFPKECPKAQGWLRLDLELTTSDPQGLEKLQRICSWGKPHLYEFGPIEQEGVNVVCFLRELKVRDEKALEASKAKTSKKK